MVFISIPNTYPIRVKSLCHGRKKFRSTMERDILSSTSIAILESILRCQRGILIYHQVKNSFTEYMTIDRLLSTFCSLKTCCLPSLVKKFFCTIDRAIIHSKFIVNPILFQDKEILNKL